MHLIQALLLVWLVQQLEAQIVDALVVNTEGVDLSMHSNVSQFPSINKEKWKKKRTQLTHLKRSWIGIYCEVWTTCNISHIKVYQLYLNAFSFLTWKPIPHQIGVCFPSFDVGDAESVEKLRNIRSIYFKSVEWLVVDKRLHEKFIRNTHETAWLRFVWTISLSRKLWKDVGGEWLCHIKWVLPGNLHALIYRNRCIQMKMKNNFG